MESQWPFIVSFPIKNGGSFHSYVNVYQRVNDFNSIFPCNRSKLWLTQQKNSAPEMHPTWKVWKQGVMTWDSHAAFATAKPGNHRNRRNRRNHELKQTKERRKTSCCTQKTGEEKRGTKKSNYTATSEPEICGKRYGKMLKTIWKVWKTSKKLEKNIIWHHLTSFDFPILPHQIGKRILKTLGIPTISEGCPVSQALKSSMQMGP
jgi:hypothetical protein